MPLRPGDKLGPYEILALIGDGGMGIVLRDLKPSNMMVTTEGAVKLLEFGLAKLVETSAKGDSTVTMGNAPYRERRDSGDRLLHFAGAGRGQAGRQALRRLRFSLRPL